jgi:hypothetical protein
VKKYSVRGASDKVLTSPFILFLATPSWIAERGRETERDRERERVGEWESGRGREIEKEGERLFWATDARQAEADRKDRRRQTRQGKKTYQRDRRV